MLFKSLRDDRFFYIDWWLTDHCNWDCSYCHQELKRGWLPFPDIRNIKKFLDSAHRHCRILNKRLHLHLTGGEVTEYQDLKEMLSYAKSLRAYVSLRTNASKSINEIVEILKSTDIVLISYHPEHTQLSHLLLCLDAASKIENLKVNVEINALPEKWSEAESLKEKINNKWPTFGAHYRMLFEDPVRNTKPLEYDKEKIQRLKDQYQDLEIIEGDKKQLSNYQTLILEKRNSFRGMTCHIGLEQIVVNAWGEVRRGHCRVSPMLGNIVDDIVFDQQGVVCSKPFCVNAFDMKATKSS